VRHPGIDAPAALFIDPAGRLWWVNGGNDTVGRIDTAAAAPESTPQIVQPPAGLKGLRGWTLDRQGKLWLTTQRPAALVRIDPDAADMAASLHHVTDARLRTPDGIWRGADGCLWFADTAAHAVVRFDGQGPSARRASCRSVTHPLVARFAVIGAVGALMRVLPSPRRRQRVPELRQPVSAGASV